MPLLLFGMLGVGTVGATAYVVGDTAKTLSKLALVALLGYALVKGVK